MNQVTQVTEIKRFYWLVPHSVVTNLCVLYQKHDMYKMQLGFIINLVYVLTRRKEFHKSKFITIYNLGREIEE